ncbi:hypothetical protein QBC46DRAFT_379629 [Diplogelasinospora grovesii]|uniref:Uncharacterized protein n=1 Tax=Diplogelasinospora grovesii TaxID=303347 RepID=A0AAN6S7H6_9PEZI|nr:hypothetical protein QBC46DRAFT_379629 [Diplogelasinospora grovesii]
MYAEVELFKDPKTILGYGYPFSENGSDGNPYYAEESSAPLLSSLLRSIVLPVPGVRDLPCDFWPTKFQGLLSKLTKAELSESYDKAALGTRKTLATAASVIHESVTRGIVGGISKGGAGRDLQKSYDRSKASGLVQAWEGVVHELVYGDLVDELFDGAAEKPSLEEHSLGVQAAVDYIIIHLATFIHHIFVLSSEGPYLLKMLANIHKLVPYSMIKQTLRIGNAATMLNGMVKLLLAKVGVGALSNWIGLTQNAEDGMNLLQRIISMVLSWDASEFRKSADKIEKSVGKGGPTKEQLAAIRQFIDTKSRKEHDTVRETSAESPTSIVAAILEDADPKLLTPLSEAQHARCMEYYSSLLSVRDRDEITGAMCRQNPDLFTRAIKDLVGTFEPMIRTIHERVDLREQLSAAETFLNDLIATSKANKTPPSVEDYVSLLRRNRQLLYNWLHEVASKCPEIRDDFRQWAKETIKAFRQPPSDQPGRTESGLDGNNDSKEASVESAGALAGGAGAAGALSPKLQELFSTLPPEKQQEVAAEIDGHATYLSRLEELSLRRMQGVLDNMAADNRDSAESGSRASMCGPGMYLARWQALLDETLVTPELPGGRLRYGRDVRGAVVQGKTTKDAGSVDQVKQERDSEGLQPPKVDTVIKELGPGFRQLAVEFAQGVQPH